MYMIMVISMKENSNMVKNTERVYIPPNKIMQFTKANIKMMREMDMEYFKARQ